MKKTIVIVLLLAMGLFAHTAYGETPPIGTGVFHVLGVDITADPAQQTVPISTGTGVNTNVVFPMTEPAISSDQLPALPSDFMVVAELTGPGITTPKIITAKPGEMLLIPPLHMKGTYILDKIRLVSGDRVVLYADPSTALIDTLEKLLITQVTSRALSIDEIESLGITINPENFTAYNFTVGFATESGPVTMELPVVIGEPRLRDNGGGGGGGAGGELPSGPPPPQLQVPNLHVSGFKMVELYEEEIQEERPEPPPIAGAVIIPGNIAFLNQFFEVMLLVTNNAPSGTPLVVSDITAEITLPAGDDNYPGSMDDPLRSAQTDQGAQSAVPV
ncbi:MAG: hypothetical protein HZB33_12160, partial [Nitrospirae bacterium]|nr:hypothetical protein [Nitrospirota bacterium]